MNRIVEVCGFKFGHDDTTTLEQMREQPINELFFNPSSATGKREYFVAYKGCLIIRNTVQFTGLRPERRTVVYLHTKSHGLYFLCHCKDIKEAKKKIDSLLTCSPLD